MWAVRRGRIQATILILAAAVAVSGPALAPRWNMRVRRPYYAEQIAAARTMDAAVEAIQELREIQGIPIDPELDPNRTGLIGAEFSELTTSLGNLEAKRTSTNPAFAALMVRYFKDAGLGPGDVVAIGASSSFPALIIATLAAAKELELEPIIINSAGSSMYGANLPGLTVAEMLKQLNRRGIIPYHLAAISPGGDGDTGAGVLFGGNGSLEKAAAESGAPVLHEPTLAASIQRRLKLYDELSGGRAIRCFVNVGGADPNYGATAASVEYPNGLNLRSTVATLVPERGLIFEYAARGVPVIHLLNVRDLALKNGLPVDPVPLPAVGEGDVYYATRPPRAWLLATLLASLALLLLGVSPPLRRSR